nr:hypothetical protein [Tanacetum cinerariifolium]
MLNPTPDVGMESIFETTSHMDVHTSTSVAPLPMSAPTLTPSTIAIITTTQQVPIPPTTAPSTLLQDLPNFSSLFGFDHRLKTLEANFSKIRDEAQKENDEFLKTIDENMQTIIKGQTSYAVAANLSEMELKKILIEKIEGNKSIHRSNEQRNIYKALVEAYESGTIILDTYRETITLKRRRNDDGDKDKEPFAGSDRGPRDGHKSQQFYDFAVNRESARDVYSKRRIIVVTELKIVEWKADKFDNQRMLCFQRLSLMFTRSIVIQRRAKDLQLDVESYQKKLNLTKPDTYRSDLKRKEAYTAYSNLRGFIYQNKDKQN